MVVVEVGALAHGGKAIKDVVGEPMDDDGSTVEVISAAHKLLQYAMLLSHVSPFIARRTCHLRGEAPIGCTLPVPAFHPFVEFS